MVGASGADAVVEATVEIDGAGAIVVAWREVLTVAGAIVAAGAIVVAGVEVDAAAIAVAGAIVVARCCVHASNSAR